MCRVSNGGRNFGLFVLTSVVFRNFGLFALGKCSVCDGGGNFGLFS
jgi:hypothetical protein